MSVRPATVHDGSYIKRALCHDKSLDSALALHQSPATEFIGFEGDKTSYFTYNWQSTTDGSSCEIGDGKVNRKPYRLVSHIFSENVPEDEVDRNRRPRSHHGYKNGVSFQNIFAPIEMKKMKPVQMTLFNKTIEKTPSKKQNCQFSVSPLTGHVLGIGGFQIVEPPKRRARTCAGRCHTPLW